MLTAYSVGNVRTATALSVYQIVLRLSEIMQLYMYCIKTAVRVCGTCYWMEVAKLFPKHKEFADWLAKNNNRVRWSQQASFADFLTYFEAGTWKLEVQARQVFINE